MKGPKQFEQAILETGRVQQVKERRERDRFERTVIRPTKLLGAAAFFAVGGGVGAAAFAILVLAAVQNWKGFSIPLEAWIAGFLISLGAAGVVAMVAYSVFYSKYLEGHVAEREIKLANPEPQRADILLSGNMGEARVMSRQRAVTVRGKGKSYKFTGAQVNRLRLWYEQGQDGGGIRRDSGAAGLGFDALQPAIVGDDFHLASNVLQEAGYVKRVGKRRLWTDQAKDFLYSEDI